jgi:hypothetical protein
LNQSQGLFGSYGFKEYHEQPVNIYSIADFKEVKGASRNKFFLPGLVNLIDLNSTSLGSLRYTLRGSILTTTACNQVLSPVMSLERQLDLCFPAILITFYKLTWQ